MNATSPEDLVRQQEATATIVSSQSAAYDSLRAAEVVLTVRERQLHAARDAIALQKQQAAQVVRRVAKLERQATASRDEVAGLVTAAEAAQASAESSRATAASAEAAAQSAKAAAEAAKTAAAKAKARDLEILKQLKIEEEKIKQQILAQAKKDRNRTVGSEAGMLLRPVPGEITSRYGYRRHPIYGYWGLHDGNDYRAPCGTPLAASETGKVMSRSYSSVWGNRLFLNLGNINGANYTVIYNHLSAYRASVGQTVGRGETVGYAGTTGWSTGCHLHFTVLKNGDPIDPNTVVGS
jgi:murein DD-endopeptidase MepM/ murein hydrolase activator NlpD